MSIGKHLTNEEIAQYAEAIDKGKYDNLPLPIRDHLFYCDHCALELMFVSEVSKEFNKELHTDKNKVKDLKIRPWQISAITIAAAAAVMFFIITYTDIGQDISEPDIAQETESIPGIVVEEEEDTAYPEEPHKPETAEVSPVETLETDIIEESTIQDKPGELLAEYKPDPNLEQLYENMKGEYRSRDVVINTPYKIYSHDYDSLRWDNPNKETLYVEFFSNEGEEVKTLIIEDEKVAIPDFPNGLYYWKLISENFDLLYVGKIIVE